jgi:DNA-binding response OmpR family regulator
MEKHILLIDDDKDELDIFINALNRVPVNFVCTQVLSADEAIKVVGDQRPPDFIFIDYNMPIKNGIECLEELKAIKELANTRFIIYSNFISEDVSIRARELGADICMKKPYLISTLSQRLKETLTPYL